MPLVIDNNILLAAQTDADKRFNARLGVNNLFRATGATVTASAETASTGLKENAYKEGFTFDFWRPGASGTQWLAVSLGSSLTADYIAIAAHDLHTTSTSFKAQYSTDGGSTWNDAHASITPATSQPVMVLFDEQSAADWRVLFNATSAFSLGVVNVGAIMALDSPIEAPWTPPHLSKRVRTISDVTEGGAFAGRSVVAEGADLTLNLRGLDMGWLRGTWEPVLRSMEQYGFFFTARDVAGGVSEAEVVYAWLQRQPRGTYGDNVNGTLRLQARGILS